MMTVTHMGTKICHCGGVDDIIQGLEIFYER